MTIGGRHDPNLALRIGKISEARAYNRFRQREENVLAPRADVDIAPGAG